ncbi:restriction endonuclease [Streptomyces sp. B6B3]|uniref:McrC family protein n=1 Tax=Streptomyces sp. B6B3 TaxID=3153570 RepID=UPI00325F6CBA
MNGPVELREYGEPVSRALPDAVGRALAAAGVVESATPDPYLPGNWRLRAGSKVGAVTVTAAGAEPVTVRIAPKVTIGRLFFLLGYSLDPRGWRDDGLVDVAEERGLLPALAHAYERQVARALGRGVLQGYRHTEDAALVVRGRILEAEQIRRRFGAALPVEIAYDEFTTDIAENRLLRAATERLLRVPGVPRDVRARLLHQRARLADVMPLVRGQRRPDWRPSRLNARYQPALRLAEMILAGASVEHRVGGRARVEGFLFDMNKVFEDFVCVALREALRQFGGRCALQARGVYLDEADTVRMRPDLVWNGEEGGPIAVADAKYKAEKRGAFPDADLYQMLAYCAALGLGEGHLVYARGSATRTSHRVRGADIVLHQHALALDRPPDALLAQLRTLAGWMARGVTG